MKSQPLNMCEEQPYTNLIQLPTIFLSGGKYRLQQLQLECTSLQTQLLNGNRNHECNSGLQLVQTLTQQQQQQKAKYVLQRTPNTAILIQQECTNSHTIFNLIDFILFHDYS